METLGNTALDNEVCYTGGVNDAETGQLYLNARYYNPQDGRFVTMDTYRGEFGDPDIWHLYSYCMNNPLNYVREVYICEDYNRNCNECNLFN